MLLKVLKYLNLIIPEVLILRAFSYVEPVQYNVQ